MAESKDLLKMTTQIVVAFTSNNPVSKDDLASVIASTYAALKESIDGPVIDDAPKPIPAVPVADSITEDFLICLEDGKPFKSLKRHLRTKFELTPEAYREKWGLPADYPMVAPGYAKARSELAKRMGLGKG